jgi:RimJ/RimL family protein N-acetyltransferase
MTSPSLSSVTELYTAYPDRSRTQGQEVEQTKEDRLNTVLRTARLVLRRPRPADARAMHECLSDPMAMRYWSTLPHIELAQSEAWVADTITALAAGDCDDFFIELDGRVIGKAGLWNGDEIGFMIHPSAWGKGYAREALQAVIAHAFAKGHTQIRADVDPRNNRSLALLTRLGFQETGRAERTFCIGGEWSDSVYLALKRG